MGKSLTSGLVGLLSALTMSCSGDDDAISAARSAGWSDVQVESSNYWNLTCEEEEKAYHIVGVNPAGEKSSATVCCGHTTFVKGCTIRYK
ncbi:hypothetical protein J4210_02540 [Candidatus Woesearchaeota archaeon]|nr:hypothetical protein [Candidatus Woesearchaeota archaeon]